MKFCIVRNNDNAILDGPKEKVRKPTIDERIVKAHIFIDHSKSSIEYSATSPRLDIVAWSKAIFRYVYVEKSIDESRLAAKELLAEESQRIRESGFVSTVTGEWTGKTTKENILRSSVVSSSSRNAKDNGKGNLKRKYKTTRGNFIELTNDQIAALDEEINGFEGFIQQCYDREFDISALIDIAGPGPEDVKAVYDAEISTGFPAYGR